MLGVLPAVLACRDAGRTLLVPRENGPEASLIQDAEVRTAHQLLAVTAWLAGQYELPLPDPQTTDALPDVPDLQDVIGQSQAKRALEIAAAGSHNLLFIGPPGTGKSMLASRLPGILPPLSEQEAQQTAAIHSIGGLTPRAGHWHHRPYRTPHHSASAVALVGGGCHFLK